MGRGDINHLNMCVWAEKSQRISWIALGWTIKTESTNQRINEYANQSFIQLEQFPRHIQRDRPVAVASIALQILRRIMQKLVDHGIHHPVDGP